MPSTAALHLYVEAVRRMLLADWDPIGMRELPEAHAKYDTYAPALARLLIAQTPREKIVDHLWQLETGRLGLTGDRAATEHFADRLMQMARRLSSPLPCPR